MSKTLDFLNYTLCEIKKSKFEKSKVYNIGIRKSEFVGKPFLIPRFKGYNCTYNFTM